MRRGKVKGMKGFGMIFLLHFGHCMMQGALRYVCCLHDGTATGRERFVFFSVFGVRRCRSGADGRFAFRRFLLYICSASMDRASSGPFFRALKGVFLFGRQKKRSPKQEKRSPKPFLRCARPYFRSLGWACFAPSTVKLL